MRQKAWKWESWWYMRTFPGSMESNGMIHFKGTQSREERNMTMNHQRCWFAHQSLPNTVASVLQKHLPSPLIGAFLCLPCQCFPPATVTGAFQQEIKGDFFNAWWENGVGVKGMCVFWNWRCRENGSVEMKEEINSGFWPEESVSQSGGGGDVRAETPFSHLGNWS